MPEPLAPDLVRDLLRQAGIASLPEAMACLGVLTYSVWALASASRFLHGLWRAVCEPSASIYDLLMALWRTHAELTSDSPWHWPPHEARTAYLRDLPTAIKRLISLLDL